MSWELHYVLAWPTIDVAALTLAASRTAARLADVTFEIESTDAMQASVNFSMPKSTVLRLADPDDGEPFDRLQTGSDEFEWPLWVTPRVLCFGDGNAWLSVRGGSGMNGVFPSVTSVVCETLADALGAPSAEAVLPEPSELYRAVARLRRFVEPFPEWMKTHAPDGDVDAAIERLWNAASAAHVSMMLPQLSAEKALRLALATWPAKFERPPSGAVAKLLQKIEWFLDERILPAALPRTRSDVFAITKNPTGHSAQALAEATAAEQLFEATRDLAAGSPAMVGHRVAQYFAAAPRGDDQRVANALRQKLERPTLAGLRKAHQGRATS